MRQRFVTSLPRGPALRTLGQYGHDRMHQGTLEGLALDSGLLVDDGSFLRFRHELFADFFAAEQLLCKHKDAAALGDALKRPINGELAEFAIGGCATVADIDEVLMKGASASLLAACLHGACGARAKEWVLGRCGELIEKLEAKFTCVRFALPDNFTEHGRIAGLDMALDRAVD